MVARITEFIARGRPQDGLRDEVGALNCHRVSRLALILVFIHLAHVVAFWPFTPNATDNALIWRNGIIVAHAVMLVVAAVFGVVALILERTKQTSGIRSAFIAGAASLSYLLFGATVAIIDQRVTSAVTPLLVASTGLAVIIVVSPAVAAVNYAIALAFFVAVIPLTQVHPELLLSARVNGITATGLGFGVALMMWRNQVLTIRQKRQIVEQQRELEAQNQELAHLATRDVLTGTLNRSQFTLDADREIARMHRTGQKACLVMLDIDHFKSVNDTYGHPGGDSTLRGVSHILSSMLRSFDILARFGGEEFAIMLPDTSLQDGVQVAERLRVAVEEHTFYAGVQPFKVTVSLGVSEISGEQPESLDECYGTADKALYQAKGDGRNCVRFAP